MASDRGVNITYWQCSRCCATFLTREAARQHTCSGGASIVEVSGTPEATSVPKDKSSLG